MFRLQLIRPTFRQLNRNYCHHDRDMQYYQSIFNNKQKNSSYYMNSQLITNEITSVENHIADLEVRVAKLEKDNKDIPYIKNKIELLIQKVYYLNQKLPR